MGNAVLDLIVIGSGITGLTAAKYAAQRGIAAACIESLLFGGLIGNINEIDGAPDGNCISGISLSTALMAEITDLGVMNCNETVTAIRQEDAKFSVVTDGGLHAAESIIIASGAQPRRLNIPGESALQYKGVSNCADCDGPMYRAKDVVVVGGGDSALQEALVLAAHCRCVRLLVRGTTFRARDHLVAAVSAKSNIHVMWNTVAEEVLGAERVEKVRARNTVDGQTFEVSCAGVFPYVGLKPSTDFVPVEILRAPDGSLMTDAALQTSMPGVFAAGAVRFGYGGLLTDAMSDAATAVSSVSDWLANHH